MVQVRCVDVWTRHGTGSHFVTQRHSYPGIQRPGDPVDPVTLFYNELQMSTYAYRGVRIELFTARVLCRVSYRVLDKVSKSVRVFISGAKKQDLHHRPRQGYICPVIVIFSKTGKNSGLTQGQNDDPVTR